MPIFDFKCKKCGYVIKNEYIPAKEMNEKKKVTRECPKCHSKADRQMGAPMFYFRRPGSN